jgi:hypothetical protein
MVPTLWDPADIHIELMPLSNIININAYCDTLQQLSETICTKVSGHLLQGVVL